MGVNFDENDEEEILTGKAAKKLMDIIENPDNDPKRIAFINESISTFPDAGETIEFEIDKKTNKIKRKEEPKTTKKIKQKNPLTQKEVYDYIISQSGKWGGFATLKAVITRHKAISTSVLSAIVDIHRKFKEWM